MKRGGGWARAIAVVGFAVLLFAYLPFRRTTSTELWWNVMPDELGRRLIFVLAAWVYLLFFCTFVWREEPDP